MKDFPITILKGIGPKTAAALNRIEICSTADLIRHYPSRFIRYPETSDIEFLKENEICAVLASPIAPLSVIRHGSLVMTQGNLSDGTGIIRVVWYHMPYLKNSIHTSSLFVFFGKAVRNHGSFYLEQPAVFKPDEYQKLAGRPEPVYPLTQGISNRTMRDAIRQALDITELPPDFLPDEILKKYRLEEENLSIHRIHDPGDEDALERARRRIVFDEFFHFLCKVRNLRERNEKKESLFRMKTDGLFEDLLFSFPFSLTDAQKKVWKDICEDLSGGHVMNRLIQGDVGSGKTAVAVLALYTAYRNGFQSVIMTPTEVLSEQHFRTILSFLEPLKERPRVLLLTGSMTKKEKELAKEKIADHEADIIIGTHAVIQSDVTFKKLALVITDEQHRFGVRQRESLAQKGEDPHVLVMSATPIPRTLAVILYGDLDISVIDSKPEGRKPILNCVIDGKDRSKAYAHIGKEIARGHQAYVICPAVEETEFSYGENVTDTCKKIQGLFGDRVRAEYLHGQMSDKRKNRIMEDFLAGKINVLVSTTVIEVGVDVPNATVMMIENADRFGLSSLHQLRGRVGRGTEQSYCIFVNTSDSENAKKRLAIVNRSNDGFEIASEDLKMRGPGELFGSAQSGELTFGIADIYNDNPTLCDAFDAVNSLSKSMLNQLCRNDSVLNL